MIQFTVAKTIDDLNGILKLQKQNLTKNLNPKEVEQEGFVTVEHHLQLLEKMNQPYGHIIAKEGEKVIGYTLVMLKRIAPEIPALMPLFEKINQLEYQGGSLAKARYFIMGQVCVAKGYRGQGVFSGLYREMSSRMQENFDYIITEISTENKRSLRAHAKVGFKNILEYVAPSGKSWVIVLLEI